MCGWGNWIRRKKGKRRNDKPDFNSGRIDSRDRTYPVPAVYPVSGRKTGYLEHLGKTLPYAAMGLLVVFCLKGVNLLSGNHGIPELLAVGLTAAVHCWKRNSLLSIGAGTVFYMVLVQMVF